MENINAKYVSQKISKTRWRPVSHSSLQQPDIFVTGSWDNEVEKSIVNAIVFNANRDLHTSRNYMTVLSNFTKWQTHLL